MRKALCLVAIIWLLGALAPNAVAEPATCFASSQDESALRAAAANLARANLHPARFSLALDLSGHVFLTRAAVAEMLVRMLGWTAEGNDPSPFSDVTADHWAAGDITLLWKEGIVKGEPGGTFAPDRRVTMAEAELMLGRALRISPDLTLENAAAALQRAGISPVTSCTYDDGKAVDYWQLLLIIDRAMSAPLYARF